MNRKEIKDRKHKKEIVKYGTKIAAVIEAICLPRLDGKALKYTQLHWRCQDWFDHPDWPEYEEIVTRCKELWEKKG